MVRKKVAGDMAVVDAAAADGAAESQTKSE